MGTERLGLLSPWSPSSGEGLENKTKLKRKEKRGVGERETAENRGGGKKPGVNGRH